MEPTTVKHLHERSVPAATHHDPLALDEHYSRIYQQDNELSLIDLWLILAKRKALIAAVITAVTLLGLAWAFFKPPTYNYTSTIEIGKTINTSNNDAEIHLIESPGTVLAKLENGYIPETLNRYVADHGGQINQYKVSAAIPKDSNVIILKSSGDAKYRSAYDTIHGAIVANIAADQNQQLSTIRKQLNTRLTRTKIQLQHLKNPAVMAEGQGKLEKEIEDIKSKIAQASDPQLRAVPKSKLLGEVEAAENRLAQLKDEEGLLRLEYKHLDDTDRLLAARISNLQAHIKTSLQQRAQAVKSISGESQAMTLLMLDSELQKNRDELAKLQERHKVELSTKRETVGKELDDNSRAQAQQSHKISEIQARLASLDADTRQKVGYYNEQIRVLKKELADLRASRDSKIDTTKQEIENLQSQLDMLVPTHTISTPNQTAEPAGPGKAIIIIMAFILGILIAILGAFAAEFLHKARNMAPSGGT